MKRIAVFGLCLMATAAQAEVWTARYGVAETFNFKLYNADGTLDVDEADGGTEVSLSCNEGAETTATNDFADEGTFYSIALTAAELQCERIAVVVAATTTEVFFIQTTNHASAMTPDFIQSGDAFAGLGVQTGTITLTTQTEFVLSDGSTNNDAYNDSLIYICDNGAAANCAKGVVEDYVGASKTVTLRTDPAIFTMGTGDTFVIMPAIIAETVRADVWFIKGNDADESLDNRDVSVEFVNGVQVCGAGIEANPWGPCP